MFLNTLKQIILAYYQNIRLFICCKMQQENACKKIRERMTSIFRNKKLTSEANKAKTNKKKKRKKKENNQ